MKTGKYDAPWPCGMIITAAAATIITIITIITIFAG